MEFESVSNKIRLQRKSPFQSPISGKFQVESSFTTWKSTQNGSFCWKRCILRQSSTNSDCQYFHSNFWVLSVKNRKKNSSWKFQVERKIIFLLGLQKTTAVHHDEKLKPVCELCICLIVINLFCVVGWALSSVDVHQFLQYEQAECVVHDTRWVQSDDENLEFIWNILITTTDQTIMYEQEITSRNRRRSQSIESLKLGLQKNFTCYYDGEDLLWDIPPYLYEGSIIFSTIWTVLSIALSILFIWTSYPDIKEAFFAPKPIQNRIIQPLVPIRNNMIRNEMESHEFIPGPSRFWHPFQLRIKLFRWILETEFGIISIAFRSISEMLPIFLILHVSVTIFLSHVQPIVGFSSWNFFNKIR